jgi:hypothetical protein
MSPQNNLLHMAILFTYDTRNSIDKVKKEHDSPEHFITYAIPVYL